MRTLTLSLLTSATLGLIGASSSFAAPVNGSTISNASEQQQLTQKTQWYGWRHHYWHRHWGYGYGRDWCYYHPYRCGRY